MSGRHFFVAVLDWPDVLDSALANTAGAGSPVTAFQQAFCRATGFTGLAMLLSLALPGRPPTAIGKPTITAGAKIR